ncbi:MAG TPA: non-heme iron oxygenase ferredoxin subunit [Chloroflexota bacterium]|jgi:nitrite reductase/ring-hydroxylating ferredoxin subunit
MFIPLPVVMHTAEALPVGEMRALRAGDREVLLARLDDGYHVVDDTCTHERCSLGDGWLEDGVVECPCHGATFDIRTGAALTLPATKPLRVYPVRTTPDGALEIEVPA